MGSVMKISTLLFFLFVATINAQEVTEAAQGNNQPTIHTTIDIKTIEPLLVNWIYAEFNVSDDRPQESKVEAYKLEYHKADDSSDRREVKWDSPAPGNFKGVIELAVNTPGETYCFKIQAIYSKPDAASEAVKYKHNVTLLKNDFVPTFTVINETNSLNISWTRASAREANYFIYHVSEIQGPKNNQTISSVNSTTNNYLPILGLEPDMDYQYQVSRCIKLKPTICSPSVNVTGHTKHAKSSAGLKSMEINILTTILLVFYCLINQF